MVITLVVTLLLFGPLYFFNSIVCVFGFVVVLFVCVCVVVVVSSSALHCSSRWHLKLSKCVCVSGLLCSAVEFFFFLDFALLRNKKNFSYYFYLSEKELYWCVRVCVCVLSQSVCFGEKSVNRVCV